MTLRAAILLLCLGIGLGDQDFDQDPSDNDIYESHPKNLQKTVRGKRLLWSYPQSPMFETMLQSAGLNYVPSQHKDPFDFMRDSYPLPKGLTEPYEEYDYVIVGAGSAGSVLAARLTEDRPRATVLLLEAGRPESLLSDAPALAYLMSQSDYTWKYHAEYQPGVCIGSEDGRCVLRKGKAVGGSSVTNNMVYARGCREDWDRIAAEGNYGWSFNELLKYFIKSERAQLKRNKDAKNRGHDGELNVENPSFRTRLVKAFLEAGKQQGFPTVEYNDPDEQGFGYVQSTIHDGHRVSAARAFLHSHKKRANLHILPEAFATKVLIEPQSKRAYGVEYIRNGRRCKARSRREVILSAGAIRSPQLLMLSGVGPQEQLEALNIPVLQSLQVGRSLHDHVTFPGVVFRLQSNNASLMSSKVTTLQNFVHWLQFGDSLLASPNAIEALGYVKTQSDDQINNAPNVELLSLGSSIAYDADGNYAASLGISPKTYNALYSSLNGVDTWSALITLLHPKSTGYLELRDSNPHSFPKIHTNYLSDPRDMAAIIDAINLVIQLGMSPAFSRYSPSLHLPTYPACPNLSPGSEEYWECAVKTLVVSSGHQTGTCRMGHPNDASAVVDPELRVYGVNGLRVADSSIIPGCVTGHSSTASVMIGEKAADLIKAAWKNFV